MSVTAQAAEVNVDGDIKEWGNVRTFTAVGNDAAHVNQWAVMQDEERIYFYIQQNGGNTWGMPVSNTYISIEYTSGRNDAFTQLRPVFDGTRIVLKNAWYGDVSDITSAFIPSQEKDKYEIEFSVPKSYFPEDEYTIHYCGASVKNTEITHCDDVDESEEEAVYNGITVDGNFSDWNAVKKKDVDRDALVQTAAVFDGDYLYIYMKETEDGALTSSGEHSDGKFTVLTDTGRNTIFKLNKDSIETIDGATVAHSNYQYEIAIPADAIKQYKESVSFGYYMEDEMLLDGIVNLQDSENEVNDRQFNGIQYDSNFADWDYYPHTLIEYATSGTHKKSDAEAALYMEDARLYGHVKSFIHLNEGEFAYFTIRVNEDKNKCFSVKPVLIDENGKIDQNPQTKNLPAGTYEYALCDISSWSNVTDVKDIKDDNVILYGKMYVTIEEDGKGTPVADEMEYYMDIETIARKFNMDASDIKMLQANYINIGDEWISIAGTSTGAVMGICLCGATVLAAFVYGKKKKKVA